jgi:hypothetical protein
VPSDPYRSRTVPAGWHAGERRGSAAHDDDGPSILSHPCSRHAVGTAVIAAYSALIGMVVPFVLAAFGRVTLRSPFLKVAVTFEPSTVAGSRTVLTKAP